MNLQSIRRAIADRLSDVAPGINVYPYMPDSPTFPCIVVTPASDYRSPRETFDDSPGYTLNYDLLVGITSRAEDAQILLDEMLSTSTDVSIEDTIDDDRTLSGLADDVMVGAGTVLAEGEPNAAVFTASLRFTVYVRR